MSRVQTLFFNSQRLKSQFDSAHNFYKLNLSFNLTRSNSTHLRPNLIALFYPINSKSQYVVDADMELTIGCYRDGLRSVLCIYFFLRSDTMYFTHTQIVLLVLHFTNTFGLGTPSQSDSLCAFPLLHLRLPQDVFIAETLICLILI
jgi:hypothetical protein